MNTYKSSDLTHNRAKVLRDAKVDGAIIQQLETNGNLRCEFILTRPSGSPVPAHKQLLAAVEQVRTSTYLALELKRKLGIEEHGECEYVSDGRLDNLVDVLNYLPERVSMLTSKLNEVLVDIEECLAKRV